MLYKLVRVSVQAIVEAKNDKVTRLAAALAFYGSMAIPPFLMVLVTMSGLLLGEKSTGELNEQVIGNLNKNIGPEAASIVNSIMTSASQQQSETTTLLVGSLLFIIISSNFFVQLRDALGVIWRKKLKGNFVKKFLVNRALSFLMVLIAGFLLGVFVFSSAVLSTYGQFVGSLIGVPLQYLAYFNVILTLFVFAIAFAIIYKLLPTVSLKWRDVFYGAIVTSILFTLGELLLGFMLRRSGFISPYGAATSLIIILGWLYISALLFLLGAEFTKVYAREHGSHRKIKNATSSKLRPSLGQQ